MSTTGRGAAAAREERLRRRLEELATAANSGDPKALAELRAFLDGHPEVEESVGDLARLAEEAWLDLLAGKDALTRECARRRLQATKRRLVGPGAGPLETLLADQIALNQLAARQAEIAAATSAATSLDRAAFHLKRTESTQRRYLAAIRVLATLRSLLPQPNPGDPGPLGIYRPRKAR